MNNLKRIIVDDGVDGGVDSDKALNTSTNSENYFELTETKKTSIIDELFKIAEDGLYFKDQFGVAYFSYEQNGHVEVFLLDEDNFKFWLASEFYNRKKQHLKNFYQIITVFDNMQSRITLSNEVFPLYLRVAQKDEKIYYNLSNKDHEVIEIGKLGFRKIKNNMILFRREQNQQEQVNPVDDKTTDYLTLIKRNFKFEKDSDVLLFGVYLISCLIPAIPHWILIFHGTHGSSKSTSMRKIRKLIDPARSDLSVLNSSIAELALTLSNNYTPCFDNISYLNEDQSNMLCMCSTGGEFTKRQHYENTKQIFLELKRCVVLNGINLIASKPDLLSRSIVIELSNIEADKRLDETTLWKEFEKDRPIILNHILNILSKALSIYENVKLNNLNRMADSEKYGYAIAEAIDYGFGDKFIEAYKENINEVNGIFIEDHPVALAIIKFMGEKDIYENSISALLTKLESIAEKSGIDMKTLTWPKASNILSRRIKEVIPNLLKSGIEVELTREHYCTKVKLKKV